MNGPEEFRQSFQDFVDAVVRIVQSNEDIDFANFQFILDLDNRVRGGGGPGSGRRSRSTSSLASLKSYRSAIPTNFYQNSATFKKKVPPHLRYTNGIHFVAPDVDGLCGWCCLLLHLVRHYGLRDAIAKCQLPTNLWHKLPECITGNDNYMSQRYGVRMAGWFQRNLSAMKRCASLLKAHFGSANQHFTVPDDAELVCAKLTKLRISVVGPQCTLIAQQSGADYRQATCDVDHGEYDDLLDDGSGDLLESTEETSPHCLYMYFDRAALHYHYVYNPLRFAGKIVGKHRWCHDCCQAMTSLQYGQHHCSSMICDKCRCSFTDPQHFEQHCQTPEDMADENLVCENCRTTCHNDICLSLHMRQCNSHHKRKECADCGRWVMNMTAHLKSCANRSANQGQKLCGKCFERYDPDDKAAVHYCAIKKLKLPKEVDIEEAMAKFYGFDFESAFISHDGDGLDTHVVNFVAVRQLGTGCEWTFPALEEFCKWLFGLECEAVFFAHNMSAYDGRLLFDHIVNRELVPVDHMVWRGSKIMTFSAGKHRFCDSLLHIQAALSEFPKIFGLDESQFAKGFFPYKFNRPGNQDYRGTIPPLAYFEPNMMSAGKRKEFLRWYAEQHSTTYDFRAELERYCISDVRILVRSLEVYMRDGMELNAGLNPLDSLTIASYAMKVYRTLHMPENMLAGLKREHAAFARRAMHGGRTDVRRMCRFVTESELKQTGRKLCYQDVQSLYPTVQFYKAMPVGAPEVRLYHGDNALPQPNLAEVATWFGFVECDLELERYMHHPVIVCRHEESGKLRADLLPKKRIVVTTPELHCALANGYRLVKVWEYHQYRSCATLFRSYIRSYLKLKIECSGMPAHIRTDADWEEFSSYHRRELGVDLARGSMVKNPGKKQLAKMMLNSLWGKFAEAGDYTVHKMCRRPDEYLSLEYMWDCGSIDITFRLQCLNGDVMVAYRNVDPGEHDDRLNLKSNVALAAFVTAWGALILWEQMDKLGKRVLYHDTDSIIYEYDTDKYNIPIGKYLGEWEDETGGKPIVQFVSTGPKTYAYAVLEDEETVDDAKLEQCLKDGEEFWVSGDGLTMRRLKYKCKSKGFSQSYHNQSKVNFKQLHRLLIGDIETIKTCSIKFNWNRVQGRMTTANEEKLLRLTYDKGVVDRSDFTVYPYGYENFPTLVYQ